MSFLPRAFCTLLVCCYPSIVVAQSNPFETAESPSSYEPWQTSFRNAVMISKQTKRPIMLVFSQSDQCPNSRALSREVFQTHEFSTWSTERVVKLEVDFPGGYQLPASIQQRNHWLRSKYLTDRQPVFPTVIFIDAEGRVVGEWQYESIDVRRWIDKAEMLIPPQRKKDDLVA